MPSPLATLEQFVERLGVETISPGAPDGARALAALDDASALVRLESGKDWEDETVPAIVQSVTLAIAYRAFKNPEGASQASVGDASVSYARESVGGAVFITKQERRAVRKAAGEPGFNTIPLATPYMKSSKPADGDEWWETDS